MSLYRDTCGYCDAEVPYSEEAYDEGSLRRYEGMPACPACRQQFAAEDDLLDAGDEAGRADTVPAPAPQESP